MHVHKAVTCTYMHVHKAVTCTYMHVHKAVTCTYMRAVMHTCSVLVQRYICGSHR